MLNNQPSELIMRVINTDCRLEDMAAHMSYHNNNRFSTKDSDNDQNGDRNCAVSYSGAWWYRHCHRSNLNGLYLDGADADFGRGINWRMCWGYYYSLKKSVMKIRRSD
jgi:ficolin